MTATIHKIALVLTFVSVSLSVYGQQGKLKKFLGLSAPEKRWVCAHPFITIKTLRISERAAAITRGQESAPDLDGYSNISFDGTGVIPSGRFVWQSYEHCFQVVIPSVDFASCGIGVCHFLLARKVAATEVLGSTYGLRMDRHSRSGYNCLPVLSLVNGNH